MTKLEVDTLKGVAIVQVIFIHLLALFPEHLWSEGGIQAWVLLISDQFSRIAIPLFIFLSWYGLAKKYRAQTLEWNSYLKQRYRKLLPQYLAWSIGIWLIMTATTGWEFEPEISVLMKLFTGQADYHLYFIPMICMLYLAFPVFFAIPRKFFKLFTILLAVATAGWYIVMGSPDFAQNIEWLQPDQLRYLIPLTWLWYGWAGIVGARGLWSERMQSRWIQLLLALVTAMALGWMVRDARDVIDSGKSVLEALQFSRLSVLAYASSFLALFLSIVPAWDHRQKTIWQTIGLHSFTLYLSHTMILRLFVAQWLHPVSVRDWLVGASITAALLYLTLRGRLR